MPTMSSPWPIDASPLPHYPRPMLRRERWLSLNGWWDYAIRPAVGSLDGEGTGPVDLSVTQPDGTTVDVSGRLGDELRVPLAKPRPWRPDDPHLYPLIVRYGDDEVHSWAGLRTVGIGPIPGARPAPTRRCCSTVTPSSSTSRWFRAIGPNPA